MRGLLETVKSGLTMPEAPTAPSTDDHGERLLALYRWYKQWSVTAHAIIRRHDHLIGLGLAERKKKDKKAVEPPVTGTDGQ